MLLFAHLGLTLASARLVSGAAWGYLLLGSMLPDIIDKPLGELLFGTPAMGRTISHTLIFVLILLAAAYYRHDQRMASIGGGILCHLALDSMWNSPITLLWPLLGAFPRAPDLSTMDFLMALLKGLSDPMVVGPEILGLAYLICFALSRQADLCSQVRRALKRTPLPVPEIRQ